MPKNCKAWPVDLVSSTSAAITNIITRLMPNSDQPTTANSDYSYTVYIRSRARFTAVPSVRIVTCNTTVTSAVRIVFSHFKSNRIVIVGLESHQ